MADKINLEIVTPEKLALREQVDEVTLPGLDGELGILPDHTPLISQLKTGVLTYWQGGERQQMHVSGGCPTAFLCWRTSPSGPKKLMPSAPARRKSGPSDGCRSNSPARRTWTSAGRN